VGKAGVDRRLAMAQPLFGSLYLQGQIGQITTTPILEFAPLEQIPDALLWSEFRRIAGQAFEMDPSGGSSRQEGFDHLAAMNRRAIPDDQQLAGQFAQEEPSEAHDIHSGVPVVLHLKEQLSVRRDRSNN
jgi:hypothetical protein